jgi:predicted metalloprotease with PDZ domain
MTETQKQVRVDLRRDPSGEPVLHIDATFPVAGPYSLQLPTWRPGRYELGQFAQYIRSMEGQLVDGTWEQLQKSDLHRWDIPTGVQRVRWAFHADILNAGSTCVMEDLLYVNPVNCMLYHPDGMDWNYQLSLTDIPSDWMIGTALPKVDGHFIARDVQHLMDSPFMASPKLWHAEYTSHGIPFHLWAYGQQTPEKNRFIADHQRFTDCQIDHFGSFPTPDYHFLYLFPEREVRHGVEHEDSTVIALGPSAKCLTNEGYDELIGIASHELYHTWNVKRIRPAEWMPYDFSRACPSRLGYIAEGVTTYMGDLFLFESGCIDLEQWCRLTEKLLMRHINNPGRLNMSVADSSYDTWLDGYQMGVPGRKGSIYVEGAVLALLCDVRIMQLTGSQYSLQMAMRILWEQYGQDRIGIAAEDYWSVLNEVAGAPEALADLREKHAYGCEETWDELAAAMEWQGLKLTQSMDENGLKRVQLSPLKD